MALSGTFYTNVGSGYRLQLEWSATQDINNNTSTITANLYWMSLGSSYTVNSSATKDGDITIDGTTSTFSGAGLASLSGNQKKLLYTYVKTVTHNSDGTKSVALSADFNADVTLSGTYYGTISVSGTATLDTIPRASSLTSSASWTAGNDLSISISRASSSFTHTVKIYVNNTLIKTITGVGTSTTASFSTTENTNIFTQLAQTSSKPSKITLETYNGGTLIGSKDYTGTCSAPSASTMSAPTSFNIGDTIPITITRNNSSFTHTVSLKNGSNIAKTYTNQGTSTSFDTSDITSTLYGWTPNSNSISLTLECITYYNGVQVQSPTTTSITANVTNSNPTFGTGYTYRDTNATTLAITGNDQYIVQNMSTVLVEIPPVAKATAVNGATMVSYIATLNGVSITQPYSSTSTVSFNFGTVNASSNLTLSIKAIDSRGNFTTTTKTVNVLPYSAPVVTTSATRLNGFDNQTTLTLSGSYSLLTISGTNKNSILAMEYRYKQNPSDAWSSWTSFTYTPPTGSTYTANNVVLNLDNLSSWDIEVRVTDKIGSTSVTKTVPVGQPIFFIDSTKKSVSVNKFPVNNSSFEVNGLTEITYGAQTLNLKAGQSADHVYMAFYADSQDQTTRSGYFGYPSSGSTTLKLANEMTNGNIELEPNGTGVVNIKGNGLTVNGNGITINKNGNYSSIIFPAQTNDPGYIKHYENNNTGIMYFSASDDVVDTDYFSFGATPSGSYTEGARITTSGKATFTGMTLNGAMTLNGVTFTKIQSGTAMTSYNASTRLKADIVFPSAFSSVPRVVAIVHWASGATSLDKMDLQYVENVTTTGFTVQITNKYGQSFVSTDFINIDWIAIA